MKLFRSHSPPRRGRRPPDPRRTIRRFVRVLEKLGAAGQIRGGAPFAADAVREKA